MLCAFTCLRAYLLGVFTCLRAYVLGVFTCLRAYVLDVLTCLRAYVLDVSTCLRAYVLAGLRVYARACYDEIFYFLTCLRTWCGFLSYLLYISILRFKYSHYKKVVCFVNQRQKCILHYKENQSAKCYGRCYEVVFTKGSLCLNVTGVLTIPLGKKEAVKQLFYFFGKNIA